MIEVVEPVSLVERLGVPGILLVVFLFYIWKFTDLQKETSRKADNDDFKALIVEVGKKADQDNVDRDVAGIKKDVNAIGAKVNDETKERMKDKSRVRAAVTGIAIKAKATEVIQDLLSDK